MKGSFSFDHPIIAFSNNMWRNLLATQPQKAARHGIMWPIVEEILLRDFLGDFSVQHLQSARYFAKKFKSWLTDALEGTPLLLQSLKMRAANMFVNRLRRRTCICNLAKSMHIVLNNHRMVSTLRSDLRAIISQGLLNIPSKSTRMLNCSLEEISCSFEWKSRERKQLSQLGWELLVLEDERENIFLGIARRKDIPWKGKELEVVMALGAEKAFDCVQWSYFFAVLERFGIGPKFVAWVKLLYKNSMASVRTNEMNSGQSEKLARAFAQAGSEVRNSGGQIKYSEITDLGFDSLLALLDTAADIRAYFQCVSTLVHLFVFQPSNFRGEEFIQLAANFQLRWNYFLSAISRALTLSNAESFGSWHLVNLLISEYLTHVLQSYMEEEMEKSLPESMDQLSHDAIQEPDLDSVLKKYSVPSEPLNVKSEQTGDKDLNLQNITIKPLGFKVDTLTGNKLIQVLVEDEPSKSTLKLNLSLGKKAVVTLKNGQTFEIHTSRMQQHVAGDVQT
ncbi:DNA-binding protein RFX8-like [Scyliorhinus torazame]|uniref:DNA-binding protein RFX8-like n=1 Tax=Scyliorhinus torazame TaxID=75743 RepID=UPI003B5CB6AC